MNHTAVNDSDRPPERGTASYEPTGLERESKKRPDSPLSAAHAQDVRAGLTLTFQTLTLAAVT